MKIVIIGIPDCKPVFREDVSLLVSGCSHFAGGERHYELVKDQLPVKHTWMTITSPLNNLFQAMLQSGALWVVFASGDPWFFGIGNTLKREFPEAEIEVFPFFNSLQLLGHRLGVNYGDYRVISLTGRNWEEFDAALIQGEENLAILTDRKNTPAAIASRMETYGYSNYRMFYGEHLGGEKEKILTLSLQEAPEYDFKNPNCFFLKKTDKKIPRRGIPETAFELLDNRPNMITKMPIRMATLASMELENKSVFWDIGACTGSVSIEARLNYPNLKVTAFEINEERSGIIDRNCKRFHAPGITLIYGNYLTVNKEEFQPPDAVFLGGYGGDMEKILDDVSVRLKNEGVIAFNSVSTQSRERFLHWTTKSGYSIAVQQQITVDNHNTVQIITIVKNRALK